MLTKPQDYEAREGNVTLTIRILKTITCTNRQNRFPRWHDMHAIMNRNVTPIRAGNILEALTGCDKLKEQLRNVSPEWCNTLVLFSILTSFARFFVHRNIRKARLEHSLHGSVFHLPGPLNLTNWSSVLYHKTQGSPFKTTLWVPQKILTCVFIVFFLF